MMASQRRPPAGVGPIALVNISAGRSGTEQVMLEVAMRLVRDGMPTVAVVPATRAFDAFEAELSAVGVEVTRFGDPFSSNRHKVDALRGYVRTFRILKPSIVHFHVPWAPTGGEAIMGARLAGVRRIVRTEHNPIMVPLSRGQKAKMLGLDRLATRVAFVSEGNRQRHLANGRGSIANRSCVIPNGLSSQGTAPCGADSRLQTRAALGLQPDSVVAVFVGALEIRKGPQDFIAIAEKVARLAGGVEFVLIGDGPDLAAMRALATSLGLSNGVRILGRRDNVRELLPAFDLFVQPSHYEGLSIAMLEALAASLPLVTTDVDGVEDVFPGGRGALVCPVGDTDAMAAGVVRLAGNAQLRKCLGDAGQARVSETFTAERMYEGYLEIYQQALAK